MKEARPSFSEEKEAKRLYFFYLNQREMMMNDKIYRILLFMKRRPGISVEAFREYYETRHAPLAAQYSAGIKRYMRRYIEPQPHPQTGIWIDPPFDVITELWFDDEQIYRSSLAYITTNTMPDEIVADEANLFDRSSFRIATVIEHESALGQ